MSGTLGPVADEVSRLVHAFNDRGRRDAVRELVKKVAALENEVAELRESANMACVEPRDECDCAGCSYAAEVNAMGATP